MKAFAKRVGDKVYIRPDQEYQESDIQLSFEAWIPVSQSKFSGKNIPSRNKGYSKT